MLSSGIGPIFAGKVTLFGLFTRLRFSLVFEFFLQQLDINTCFLVFLPLDKLFPLLIDLFLEVTLLIAFSFMERDQRIIDVTVAGYHLS
jgi:hypothetical protein